MDFGESLTCTDVQHAVEEHPLVWVRGRGELWGHPGGCAGLAQAARFLSPPGLPGAFTEPAQGVPRLVRVLCSFLHLCSGSSVDWYHSAETQDHDFENFGVGVSQEKQITRKTIKLGTWVKTL